MIECATFKKSQEDVKLIKKRRQNKYKGIGLVRKSRKINSLNNNKSNHQDNELFYNKNNKLLGLFTIFNYNL